MNSKFLAFFLFIFSFTSTSFAKHFKQENSDRKEIVCEPIEISHGRWTYDSWNCTINSAKEFRNIVGGRSGIDFTKYTLLGIVSSAGGCKSPTVNHTVFYTQSKNSYQYELAVQENGGCEINFHFEIWCLIPKINNTSKIEFFKTLTTKP